MKEGRQNLKYRNIEVIIFFIFLLLMLLTCHFLSRPSNPGIPVRQKVQFNAFQAAIELFAHENNGYPPSVAFDGTGEPYCGAMKLSEAMMGRDLLGFHPDSVFRADGMDSTNTRQIYPLSPTTEDLKARMGTLLQFENANAYRLLDIYGSGKTAPFQENSFVLCDVFTREMGTGQHTGMPILYYKANTSHTEHDVNNPDNPKNIYNYKDNHALLSLGVPWKSKKQHPLFVNPKIFYEMTGDWQDNSVCRPYRSDSYILISAGYDGLYGTKDDICNFDWKYGE
ncbi:MAG: hypothetical protein ACYS6K_21475 [Planctomycetota bacterium]|jgi:hypothetical protein